MKLPLIAFAVLLLLICGGYTGYWFYVAGRLQTGIEAWIAQQRAAGIELTLAEGGIGGFPLAFRRDFGAAKLALAGPAPLGVETSSLVAEMRPWNINQIRFTAVSAKLAATPGLYQAAELSGEIGIPKAPPTDYHQPFIGFDLAAQDVTLPDGPRAVAASPIETLAVQGAVMGPVPQAANLTEALAGWSAAGGVLEIKSFTFVQAPLNAAGDGTLALDQNLQPIGALAVHAYGVAETLAQLEQDGLIDPNQAKTAKLIVGGLAKPDDTGKPRFDVSLSLQDGHLWLGPVKLARLPSFNW
ncbi:DUF2125 domain-containing protein [Dongia sp.]|uniref:DUF2125 domain-containing protein n=1 Tax=Dongia sp. TaxID=1977262 RepID=UPI0035B314C5